ncbi:MAG: hypothetical protein FWF06_02570 [Symbiobacteriaceae bacterium]|nr:hypothetical protein [Symbiobacteriaceae bacterium]
MSLSSTLKSLTRRSLHFTLIVCLLCSLGSSAVLGEIASPAEERLLATGEAVPEPFLPLAYEDQQQVLTNVIPLIKSKISVPARLSEFDSSIQLQPYPIMYLRWSLPQNLAGYTSGYEVLMVTCDFEGRIIYMDHYQYDYNNTVSDRYNRLPQVTVAEAEEEAAAVIARAFAGEELELALTPTRFSQSGTSGSYALYFQRYLEGIPVLGQGISVNYDTTYQRVSYLSRSWEVGSTITLTPSSLPLLEVEAAEAAFREKIPLELVYISTQHSPDSKYIADGNYYNTLSQPYLVYRLPSSTSGWLDAYSGELYSPASDRYYIKPYYSLRSTFGASAEASLKSSLRPEERRVVEEIAEFLTVAELEAKLRAIPELYFPQNATRSFNSYNQEFGAGYIASLSWSVPYSTEEMAALYGEDLPFTSYAYTLAYIYATMDPFSGELISYEYTTNYPPYYIYALETASQEREGLSEAELLTIAERLLQQVAPEKLAQSQLKLSEGKKEPDKVRPLITPAPYLWQNFVWSRQANGLDYVNNSLHVALDPITGAVLRYSYDWKQVEFPSVEGVYSLEEATQALTTSFPLQLYYLLESTEDPLVWQGVLVYGEERCSSVMVAAATKEMLVFDGTLWHLPGSLYYTDMVGHPQQDLVEYLASFGLLDTNNPHFLPDTPVTQRQYLQSISLLVGNYYFASESAFYNQLLWSRVLDAEEVNPEAAVTAGDALRYLLRLVGHREVAEMEGIFPPVWSIPRELAGYAAIGSALGLLELSNWQPGKEVTRLDQAMLLYAFLARP